MEEVEPSINFARLVGFEQVADDVRGGVDFRDGAVGSKLGAKRGEGEAQGAASTFVAAPVSVASAD